MRLSIDWELCIGSGQCVAMAPSVFRLVPMGHGYRAVLAQVGGGDAALVAAAEACPTLAIHLTDDLGADVYPPPYLEHAARTGDQPSALGSSTAKR